MSLSPETWMDDIVTWPALDLGKIFAFILSKKEIKEKKTPILLVDLLVPFFPLAVHNILS